MTEADGDDDTLAEAFWKVARLLRHRTRAALAPWDISPSQARALGVLARHGVLRPGALAEHLRIAPRSATEVVDDLQRRGLVERRPDPNDRRATLVALTAEGVRTSTAIRATRQAEADRLFAELTPGDRDDLARILRTLHG
ncbi:MarR family winged helix-turn-helix transcriptional regulator [Micromonospora avicenniae]|uniref:DNA-binding transcriptional regulator, MarR family n=1 Tax=Micromonospora avicenniae TaxID=1198245 RepID=A0A1N7E4A2_9ACTN|nr:MarR family transcriptional regulator [Micromonospora avicenniae]SIR82929.1 DNA-binding transcriptional regulator, MarR family [Micromonospora avicenniae]